MASCQSAGLGSNGKSSSNDGLKSMQQVLRSKVQEFQLSQQKFLQSRPWEEPETPVLTEQHLYMLDRMRMIRSRVLTASELVQGVNFSQPASAEVLPDASEPECPAVFVRERIPNKEFKRLLKAQGKKMNKKKQVSSEKKEEPQEVKQKSLRRQADTGPILPGWKVTAPWRQKRH